MEFGTRVLECRCLLVPVGLLLFVVGNRSKVTEVDERSRVTKAGRSLKNLSRLFKITSVSSQESKPADTAITASEKKTLGPTSISASNRTLWKSPLHPSSCQRSIFL